MENIEELLQQANESYQTKNYEIALGLYNQVLLLDASNYTAMIRVNELKEKVQIRKENITPSSEEMKIFNGTLLRLAQSAKNNKMYEKSLNLYKQILETDPKNKEALAGIAEVEKAQ
jgi:tetratricopeptide (TPR) repeat protein